MRKQTKIAKNLMEKLNWLLSLSTTNGDSLWPPLVIRTAMSEQSIMAVDAKRVDAIMLFLRVWTARTPFFGESWYTGIVLEY